MSAVVTTYTSKAMGKVATRQVFLYHFSYNGPPESIFPFIPLVIDPFKLLQVISDALIEWRFLRGAGAVYSQLFCHNGCYKEEVF